MRIGSICSGIEAATVAWEPLGATFEWFSEIAPFPSQFLSYRYPNTPNIGNLCDIPRKILCNEVATPELICGGTPCQAFSLSGHKRGLDDERGQLTLRFIEAIEANDEIRGEGSTLVFWENVEGVLSDKTNAFGCFLSGLAGCDDVLPVKSWTTAGLLRGPKRNIAWRVLDAKYFGVPQQRKRLYVIAGGKDFSPENVLFESHKHECAIPQDASKLVFTKDGKQFEFFKEYSACLYSAYGTKWNGNAAAYSGALFVSENGRLRRLTPLECERLMGFPDNYTNVPFAKPTTRYQGVGNSWAVPVVRWIGNRLFNRQKLRHLNISQNQLSLITKCDVFKNVELYRFDNEIVYLDDGSSINTTYAPETTVHSSMYDILDTNAGEKFFITPVGCRGILRRKVERGMTINPRLEQIMTAIASQTVSEEIENRAQRQHRGAFSLAYDARMAAGKA